MLRTLLRRLGLIPSRYVPSLNKQVDLKAIEKELTSFLDRPDKVVAALAERFSSWYGEQGYAEKLGEDKTLCYAESLIMLNLLDRFQPSRIVEIGTQFGKSTRRIIDMVAFLGLESRITCFDIADEVRFFKPDEADLILKDVTDSFREDVLAAIGPQLIFLDARPYHLLRNVISECLAWPGDWVLAIHDCAPGLCNPDMRSQSKEDLNISSATGCWERHVLAELFGAAEPAGKGLNSSVVGGRELRIFDTPHGLAVIKPVGCN